MANEVDITQGKLNNTLNHALDNATAIITKDYLGMLEQYEILLPSEEDIDIEISDCGKFYRLEKLVLNQEENFLHKLTTIVNVASSIDCSIATIVHSDGHKVEYYIGILSKNSRDSKETSVKKREADAIAFKGALTGNLIGSDIKEVAKEDVISFKNNILMKKNACYSAVSGIVGIRDKEDRTIEGYVQGIENLVDSLTGQKYTIVMLADPLSSSEIQIMQRGYEILHTQLSTFAQSSVTINESDNLSLSTAQSNGITKGITTGIALTQSNTKSKGTNFGVNASVGINYILTANVGMSAGVSSGTANTSGKTNTHMESQQQNTAVTKSTSTSKTEGKSLQLTYENRSVKSLLNKIDKHIERLDQCESFGAFNCAAYVIADSRETAHLVASNYNALMRGKDSSVQASQINSWYKAEDTIKLSKYMGSLVHPRFRKNREDHIIVTPASIVSGDEIAIQIGLPKKSVTGITVIPMAPFGRNVIEESSHYIELGSLYHMGHDEGSGETKQKVRIDIDSLSMHTFITGSTGSGKSTTIYSILDKLIEHNVNGSDSEKIKFLVIEPAKGEYKDRFANYPNVNVYGSNHKKTPLLRINPFSFPDEIHVLEHIDRLIEIFNVCWPMYAAMPAILKDAVERSYVVSGWNLLTSEYRYEDQMGMPMFPSFHDVLDQIQVVLSESQYSSENKGNYIGALCTRLKSLTTGLYGQMLCSDELPASKLFDENVIVDLSRIGSSETKSFIMGLLVMKLQEYRVANAKAYNAPLNHVTVLEEAHHILKRTSTEQASEGANLLGKSVEMLANAIAEMRTYGEGFVIADQAPGLLDMSVIRNTNTKIILRIPDMDDRKLVGRAASLNDEQIVELSRLKTFVAAVYQNNWLEPVLCHIDKEFKEVSKYRYNKVRDEGVDSYRFIEYLLVPKEKTDAEGDEYLNSLRNDIFKLSIPSKAKLAFLRLTHSNDSREIQKLRGQVAYSLFNSEVAFSLAKETESKIESWFQQMKTVLEPDIMSLDEKNQMRVVAMLTKEFCERNQSKDAKELYENMMNYL